MFLNNKKKVNISSDTKLNILILILSLNNYEIWAFKANPDRYVISYILQEA